jgi:hypothetical protein
VYSDFGHFQAADFPRLLAFPVMQLKKRPAGNRAAPTYWRTKAYQARGKKRHDNKAADFAKTAVLAALPCRLNSMSLSTGATDTSHIGRRQ